LDALPPELSTLEDLDAQHQGRHGHRGEAGRQVACPFFVPNDESHLCGIGSANIEI